MTQHCLAQCSESRELQPFRRISFQVHITVKKTFTLALVTRKSWKANENYNKTIWRNKAFEPNVTGGTGKTGKLSKQSEKSISNLYIDFECLMNGTMFHDRQNEFSLSLRSLFSVMVNLTHSSSNSCPTHHRFPIVFQLDNCLPVVTDHGRVVT